MGGRGQQRVATINFQIITVFVSICVVMDFFLGEIYQLIGRIEDAGLFVVDRDGIQLQHTGLGVIVAVVRSYVLNDTAVQFGWIVARVGNQGNV